MPSIIQSHPLAGSGRVTSAETATGASVRTRKALLRCLHKAHGREHKSNRSPQSTSSIEQRLRCAQAFQRILAYTMNMRATHMQVYVIDHPAHISRRGPLLPSLFHRLVPLRSLTEDQVLRHQQGQPELLSSWVRLNRRTKGFSPLAVPPLCVLVQSTHPCRGRARQHTDTTQQRQHAARPSLKAAQADRADGEAPGPPSRATAAPHNENETGARGLGERWVRDDLSHILARVLRAYAWCTPKCVGTLLLHTAAVVLTCAPFRGLCEDMAATLFGSVLMRLSLFRRWERAQTRRAGEIALWRAPNEVRTLQCTLNRPFCALGLTEWFCQELNFLNVKIRRHEGYQRFGATNSSTEC